MPKSLVEIKGFDELRRKIQLIANDKDKKRQMIQILKQVSKLSVNAAKANVPVQRSYSNIKSRRSVRGGSLKQSIGNIVGKKGRSKENAVVYVGPRVRKGSKYSKAGRNTYGDGWYGHMVDQGHKIYGNKRRGNKQSILKRNSKREKGKVVGEVAGSYFMEKAFKLTKGMVTSAAEAKIAKYIQYKIKRLSK
jgi:hypothetical protein